MRNCHTPTGKRIVCQTYQQTKTKGKTWHFRPSRRSSCLRESTTGIPSQFIPELRLSRKAASMWTWLQPPACLGSCRLQGEKAFVLQSPGSHRPRSPRQTPVVSCRQLIRRSKRPFVSEAEETTLARCWSSR